ncbi:MAG: InlB B-repeat-containing protein [Candidatus Parcubacteria bacterium]|nr:InlB B-repeat-containing protein [Candidatus Parcubacteria bacterium]
MNSYTVTFNKNGGDTEANPTSTVANYNTTVTLPAAPTKTGYTFASWNTLANGSGSAFTSSTPVVADITVYAQWNAPLTTPTFSPNSGAIALGVTTITLASDSGSTIYYTTDGSTPTTGSASVATGATITLSSVANPIKALAAKSGYPNSAIGTSGTYTQAATANLSGLAISDSPGNYTFVAGTYTYSNVTSINSAAHIHITPTGSGTITVNGTTVVSGEASGEIALTAGVEATITTIATETGKSAKTYTIYITRIPAIGGDFQGGKVAYVDGTGLHGFIVATADQSTGAQWGCYETTISGADGTAIGTGNQNTIDIMAGCSTAGIAARLCGDLDLNGYTDWYLPSKDELNQLWVNRVAIGVFVDGTNYRSSSEVDSRHAWLQDFYGGFQDNTTSKAYLMYVRAIRSF